MFATRDFTSALPALGHQQVLVGLWIVALGVCVSAGCRDGRSSVGGRVTLDGQPVEGSRVIYGKVSFYRKGGGGAPAIGVIKESGAYSVNTGGQDGLEPGDYNVAVTISQILPPAEPGGLTTTKPLSPRKYARPSESGFEADVKPGSNTFDFALVSDEGK